MRWPTAVKARVVNNGQSCIAAKRFIVADEIADKFERAFVAKMEALKVGDPFDEKTDVGPLATPGAVQSLQADVQKSVDAGARVLTGGKPNGGPGNFYPPTVLSNVPKNSPAGCAELFGPVASIFRVKNAEEAVRVANDHRYGLGASAWTNDARERDRFSSTNWKREWCSSTRWRRSDLRMPFGGVERSGFGRELSVNGIREFTNIKTVWIRVTLVPRFCQPRRRGFRLISLCGEPEHFVTHHELLHRCGAQQRRKIVRVKVPLGVRAPSVGR